MTGTDNRVLVPAVLIQFVMKDRKHAPAGLVTEQGRAPGERTPGRCLCSQTEKVDLGEFVRTLFKKGYFVAEASVQERHVTRAGKPKTFYLARFLLTQSPDQIDPRKHAALRAMVHGTAWTMEAYLNPSQQGEFLCVHCTGRSPLTEAGQPKMVWQRSASGKELRDLPKVPEVARKKMVIDGEGTVTLVDPIGSDAAACA